MMSRTHENIGISSSSTPDSEGIIEKTKEAAINVKNKVANALGLSHDEPELHGVPPNAYPRQEKLKPSDHELGTEHADMKGIRHPILQTQEIRDKNNERTIGEKIQEGWENAKEKTKELAHDAKEKISDAAESTKEALTPNDTHHTTTTKRIHEKDVIYAYDAPLAMPPPAPVPHRREMVHPTPLPRDERTISEVSRDKWEDFKETAKDAAEATKEKVHELKDAAAEKLGMKDDHIEKHRAQDFSYTHNSQTYHYMTPTESSIRHESAAQETKEALKEGWENMKEAAEEAGQAVKEKLGFVEDKEPALSRDDWAQQDLPHGQVHRGLAAGPQRARHVAAGRPGVITETEYTRVTENPHQQKKVEHSVRKNVHLNETCAGQLRSAAGRQEMHIPPPL